MRQPIKNLKEAITPRKKKIEKVNKKMIKQRLHDAMREWVAYKEVNPIGAYNECCESLQEIYFDLTFFEDCFDERFSDKIKDDIQRQRQGIYEWTSVNTHLKAVSSQSNGI